MKLETFFNKFDELADTPDAVAKMRELILRLAMQGKLVSQNPCDEPADSLVVELKAEVSDKNGRRTAPLPLIAPDETPFELPAGWVWERLGNIGETNIGLAYSPQDVSDVGTPVLRSSNVQNGKLDFDDLVRVTCEPKRSVMVQDGDLLICARNGSRALVGKVALIEDLKEPAAFGAFMAIFRSRVNRFLYHFICSPLFRRMIDEVNTTTINQITQNNLRSTLAPIPPLAEQKRIVAKVDELMALCDRLEAQQQEREEKHAALARASLARFDEAPTSANLDFLFHKSYDIKPADLRKSILTLAVQGKLVSQDPNDEPVESLLASRTTKSPATSLGDDLRFDLPGNWQWVRLGYVGELINGDRSKNYPNKAEYAPEGVPWINTGHIKPDGTLSIDSMHYITRKKFDSLRSGKVQLGDLVYCLRGATLGKTAIITQFEEGAVASSLVIVRLSPTVDPRFAYRVLTSPLGCKQILQFDNGSAQPNLSANSVKKYWIPLPPLAEQRRIVAKVDQLMALVNQLETQLTASRSQATNLMNAVVGELTAAA